MTYLYLNSILKVIYSSGGKFNIKDILDVVVYGKQYWFCYCIFVIYIISILFWKMTSRQILMCCITIISMNVVINTMNIQLPDILQIKYVVYNIPFFGIGMYLKRNKECFRKNGYFLCFLTPIIFVFLYLKMNSVEVMFLKYFSTLILCFILYKIVCHIPLIVKESKIINNIARYSLQIMFLDSFFKVILYKIISTKLEINISYIFVIAILNIILSYVVCVIVEKIPIFNLFMGFSKK